MKASWFERLVPLAHRAPQVGWLLMQLTRRGLVAAPNAILTARFPDGRLIEASLSDDTQRRILLGAFEPHETTLVRSLLRPGDTFVDVGAHIGWFTTLGGVMVGRSGRVVAVEAYPPNADQLERNVAANSLACVQVFRGAAGRDEAGIVGIGVQDGSDSGSATSSSRPRHDVYEVPVVTLDHCVPGEAPVRLLKIDVEGLEESVLAGAGSLLGRTENVVIELNRSALAASDSSPEALVKMLNVAGFSEMALIGQAGMPQRLPDFSNLLASRPGSGL